MTRSPIEQTGLKSFNINVNTNDSRLDSLESHGTVDNLDHVRASLTEPSSNRLLARPGEKTDKRASALPDLQLVSYEQPQPSEAERTKTMVKKLIDQLADDRYATRVDAQGKLEQVGLKALTQLQDAAKNHPDPEARRRARHAAEKIDRIPETEFPGQPLAKVKNPFERDDSPHQPFKLSELADLARLNAVDAKTGKSRAAGIASMVNDLKNVEGLADTPGMKERIDRLQNLGSDYQNLDKRKAEIADTVRKVHFLEVTNEDSEKDLSLIKIAKLEGLQLVGTKHADKALEQLNEQTGLRGLGLYNSSVTDKGLESIKGTAMEKTLKWLGLSATKITDDGLQSLTGMRAIEEIFLNDTNVTDKGLKHVGKLTTLNDVDLSGSKISGDGLKNLAALKDLKRLELKETDLSGPSIEHLSGLKKLNYLRLDGAQVSDEQLKHLAALTGLENVNLSATAVSDLGLKGLKELPKLSYLGLSNTRVSDQGMKQLEGMDKLKNLILAGNPAITDAAIDHLAKLKNLERLDVRKTSITPAGLARLKKIFPQADISADPPPPAPPVILI